MQLKLPISAVELDLLRQPFEICTVCNTKKYFNQIEGDFPNFLNNNIPEYPIQKSKEYYGAGGYAAHKWIIITQDLRQKMIQQGIRGGYVPLR